MMIAWIMPFSRGISLVPWLFFWLGTIVCLLYEIRVIKNRCFLWPHVPVFVVLIMLFFVLPYAMVGI